MTFLSYISVLFISDISAFIRYNFFCANYVILNSHRFVWRETFALTLLNKSEGEACPGPV